MKQIVFDFHPDGNISVNAEGYESSNGICKGLDATQPFEKALADLYGPQTQSRTFHARRVSERAIAREQQQERR